MGFPPYPVPPSSKAKTDIGVGLTATAVQIEVRVDESGAVQGVNRVEDAFKRVAAATIQHNQSLQQQREILGSLKNGMEVTTEDVHFLADAQFQAKGTAALLREEQMLLASALGETSAAAAHTAPQMAAASGAVRELNGNLSVRAAERFLATTLQLGPALQAAFPVVGAIAMIDVLGHVYTKFHDLTDAVTGWTSKAKKYYQELVEENTRLFASFSTVATGQERIAQLNRQIEILEQSEKNAKAVQSSGDIFSVAGVTQRSAERSH